MNSSHQEVAIVLDYSDMARDIYAASALHSYLSGSRSCLEKRVHIHITEYAASHSRHRPERRPRHKPDAEGKHRYGPAQTRPAAPYPARCGSGICHAHMLPRHRRHHVAAIPRHGSVGRSRTQHAMLHSGGHTHKSSSVTRETINFNGR